MPTISIRKDIHTHEFVITLEKGSVELETRGYTLSDAMFALAEDIETTLE